jgi:hypothetical protein
MCGCMCVCVAADWERVSVVVCPSKAGGRTIAALLSQHNHNQLINCIDNSKQAETDADQAPQDAAGPVAPSQCSWQFGDDVRV